MRIYTYFFSSKKSYRNEGVLAEFTRTPRNDGIFKVDGGEDEVGDALYQCGELWCRYLARQSAASDLEEPCILHRLRPQRQSPVAEHGVPPQFEAR